MKIVAHNARWIVVETVPATGVLKLVELEDGSHPNNARGFWFDQKTGERGPETYLFLAFGVAVRDKSSLLFGPGNRLPSPESLANKPMIKFDDSITEAPRKGSRGSK